MTTFKTTSRTCSPVAIPERDGNCNRRGALDREQHKPSLAGEIPARTVNSKTLLPYGHSESMVNALADRITAEYAKEHDPQIKALRSMFTRKGKCEAWKELRNAAEEVAKWKSISDWWTPSRDRLRKALENLPK